MLHLILSLMIIISLMLIIYEQIVTDKLNGNTQLSVPLKNVARKDSWIMISLIVLTLASSINEQAIVEPKTLFLLGGAVLIGLYMGLFRTPLWLFKSTGFYLSGLFIEYAKIQAVNLSEYKNQPVFVIDLKNGKRLLAQLKNATDIDKITQFLATARITK